MDSKKIFRTHLTQPALVALNSFNPHLPQKHQTGAAVQLKYFRFRKPGPGYSIHGDPCRGHKAPGIHPRIL